MNILSIDWDYFIKADARQRYTIFPDGGNEKITSWLRATIWAGRYAVSEELLEIDSMKGVAEDVCGLIRDSTSDFAQVIIRDSHRHIYDYIKERDVNKEEPLNIVNIDYHHDLYDVGSEEVDAGNWFRKIMEEEGSRGIYTWIAREDSEIADIEEKFPNLYISINDFTPMWNTDWDMIYICRSAMWSPPHLDKDFIESFKWMMEEYPTITEVGIFEDRYNRVFLDEMAVEKQFIEKSRENIKKEP